MEDGNLFLRDSSQPGSAWEEEKVQHFPYSPFPQFQAITPAQDSLINDARPEIKVTIKSGSNIIGSEIVLKIDDVPQTLPSYANAKQIQVSFTPTEDLSDGQHTLYVYAKNELSLEDDTSVGFTIGSSVFSVMDENQRAIPDTGFAATETLFVTGTLDTARITLDGPSPQEVLFSPGENAAAEFDYLYDGHYTVSAYDTDNRLINSLTFLNDLVPPWVYVTDADGNLSGPTQATSVIVSAEDDGSGVAKVVLDGPSGSTRTFSGEHLTVTETFSGLALGAYTAWVYDRSGNVEKRLFWVVEPVSESNHEPPYLLEDVSMGAAFRYNTDTDSDGNQYTVSDGQLIKNGNTSAGVPTGGNQCAMSYYYGPERPFLAVDKVNGRIYTAACAGGGPGETIRITAFDTELNLLAYVATPPLISFEGIFVDKTGHVWVEGSVYNYNGSFIQVRRYGPGLIGEVVMDLDPYSIGGPVDTEDSTTVAVDPRGGLVAVIRSLVWHVTTDGFGIPSNTLVNQAFARLPMALNAEGSLFGVAENPDTGNLAIVKVSTDNAFIWDPPYIDIENGQWPTAMRITEIGKLDLVVCDNAVCHTLRYSPLFSTASQDGFVTLNSLTAGVVVSTAAPETQALVGAAAQAASLITVSSAYEVNTGTAVFSTPPSLSFAYSTTTLFAMGLDPWIIGAYEYSPDDGWVYMDDQVLDEDHNIITAKVSGNARIFAILAEPWDYAAPAAQMSVKGVPLEDGGTAYVTTVDSITITAEDFGTYGIISGVQGIIYGNDAEFSDQIAYTGPFTLSVGTHTIYYSAYDNAYNYAYAKTALITVGAEAYSAEITPSSGPIGLPFVITGTGFGGYKANLTTVLIGGTTAPITSWSTTTIKGTVPGALPPGEYPVSVTRGTTTITEVQPFTVTLPVVYALTPSSGPIGMPFVLTGASFGNYKAGYTRVLIGGATAQITSWTDLTIKGKAPGSLPSGDHALVVERELNGGIARSNVSTFSILTPEITAVTPSTGSIGAPFTITGLNFGNYLANYTRVLIGGTTATVSAWHDSSIKALVPGKLSSGDYELAIEREQAGWIVRSSTAALTVADPEMGTITPSSGPIGLPFIITGTGFGNYKAGYTRVLLGDTTAPISSWTDTAIKGTVPGSLITGEYAVAVEREMNGGFIRSSTGTFTVTMPYISTVTPISGPIGLPVVITGNSFGNYKAGYTRVLIGGTTAPVTSWTDQTIKATVPGGLAT
ncbi:MAG: IPT/TIG domain-containing protein, partial [Patescibacteria group bacterium]